MAQISAREVSPVSTASIVAPLRYTLAQAQKALGLSKTTLYKRIGEGKIRTYKDGARTYVDVSEVERYARECSALGQQQ